MTEVLETILQVMIVTLFYISFHFWLYICFPKVHNFLYPPIPNFTVAETKKEMQEKLRDYYYDKVWGAIKFIIKKENIQ